MRKLILVLSIFFLLIFTTITKNSTKEIEKQIYNASIRVAKLRHIKRKWENAVFKSLYISKIKSFYSNISSNSYVNNPNFKDKIVSGEINVNQMYFIIISLSYFSQ